MQFTDEQQRFIDEHYQLLPKDADGVPIRVGDVMENIVCPPVHREVTGVGAECFYGWDEGNGRYLQFGANCYRHYHAPTVEDVLRDVVTLCHNTWKEESPFHFYDVDDVMKSGNIAEYAAKLRLVEEGA